MEDDSETFIFNLSLRASFNFCVPKRYRSPSLPQDAKDYIASSGRRNAVIEVCVQTTNKLIVIVVIKCIQLIVYSTTLILVEICVL